ncbi:ABC transporter ATP-binding protein [Kosmotoga olearia]|uniref:ABC transporter related n=1 Tax=Kosmotoga olearia (strain ATCC BAA-1733 / DSM 21960 / TBF 19.5.1) TaxID=521045 RepID=C5CF25_KOSOT|nr:ABC transporter ATP-binding protein [Kosmotoga olearia]ACR80290.1 ABC transporter related [Kosmotoga olearia TBF 19.5.1]
MSDFFVRVEGLTYRYTNEEVLKNISFSVEKGKVLSILGPNGSGKSTLLKIIVGILRDYSGSVKILDKEVKEYSIKHLAMIASYIPQEFSPVFDLKNFTIVSFGRNPHLSLFRGLNKRDYEIIEASMKSTEVYEFRERRCSTLSGGEKQRVIIAKSLAQEGQLLLLDEFTTHLDPGHSQKLLDLTLNLIKTNNLTAIMVAHDVNQAIKVSSEIMFLKDGKIISKGHPEEVITEELLEKVYGVKSKIIKNPINGKPLVIFH